MTIDEMQLGILGQSMEVYLLLKKFISSTEIPQPNVKTLFGRLMMLSSRVRLQLPSLVMQGISVQIVLLNVLIANGVLACTSVMALLVQGLSMLAALVLLLMRSLIMAV